MLCPSSAARSHNCWICLQSDVVVDLMSGVGRTPKKNVLRQLYIHTVVFTGRCRYSMFRYVSIYPKLNRAASFASEPAIPTNQVFRCIKWDGHPTVQHQSNPKFEWFTTIDCPITRKYIEMQFWSTTFLFLLGGTPRTCLIYVCPTFQLSIWNHAKHGTSSKNQNISKPHPHLAPSSLPFGPRMAPANRFSWEHAERQLPGRCASPSATASRPRGELRSAFCR